MRFTMRDVTAKLFETVFYGLRFSRKLNNITLDDSNLFGLSNKTFQYLAETPLKIFRSRGSKILTLPSGTFHSLPNLQYLDLQSNFIERIEENAFLPHNELITLDLAKNRLYKVPNATAVNLENLKCLVLRKNAITWIWKNSFDGYKMLEELYLDSNHLTKIFHPFFRYISNLKILHLSGNQIKEIPKVAFANLQHLTVLYLDSNELWKIEEDAFAKNPNLTTLVLNFNDGLSTHIDLEMLLKPLQKLTYLHLVGLGLTEISENTFKHTTNLTVLTMSSNFLTTLSPTLFQNQTNLKVLSIMKNKLLTLNREVIDELPNLQLLDASSNVFACDCRIQWFADWIRLRYVYVRRLDSTTCIPPKQKNKVPLLNLHLERECMSYTFYYACWTGLASFIVLVTLASVLYRLRWYIRYDRHFEVACIQTSIPL